MKNKTLSAYKKKKLIESFCDELTATQAAHRLNLDRNTVNKYFKRIRECIAGYREYQKMKLMITVMSGQEQQVPTVSKFIPAVNSKDNGIPIRIIWLEGQLLTDVESLPSGEGSKYMINVSSYFNGCSNGQDQKKLLKTTGENEINQVANDFHLFAINRFKKYFGIKNEYAYLYVKEAEFVFNERDAAQREKVLNKMVDQIFL
jgi:transposase-like protein